jgi:hypothetical protein
MFTWRAAVQDVTMAIAMLSGIGTLILIYFNVRKTSVETDKSKLEQRIEEAKFAEWVLRQCDNCNRKDHCVFARNRPPTCKWETETEAKETP